MPDPQTPPPADPWAGEAPAAPSSGTLVWDVQAGRPTYIPAEHLDTALASGNFRAYGATQGVTRTPGGAVLARDPHDVAGAIQAGERPDSQTADLAAQNASRREAAFDTVADGVGVLVDGIVDAASMGIIHNHGENAEVANKVHAGKHALGGLIGFIGSAGVGAEGSALREITSIGKATPLGLAERGAQGVARGLIPEAAAGSRAEVLAKGARGAVTNAAIMAGYDAGHQASDALIEDKPFSGEHIANQIPAGLLLGGVLEAASGALTRTLRRDAARSALSAQDGLVNPESALSQRVQGHFDEAVGAWDQVVDRRAREIQILDGLQKDGHLVGVNDLVGARKAALDAALSARKALEKFDLPAIAAKGTGKEAAQAAAAMDAYGAAVNRLDHVMKPGAAELGNVAMPGGPAGKAPDAMAFDQSLAGAEAGRAQEWGNLRDTKIPSGTEVGHSQPLDASEALSSERDAFARERNAMADRAAQRGPHLEAEGITPEEFAGNYADAPETARGPDEGHAAPDAQTGGRQSPQPMDAAALGPDARIGEGRVAGEEVPAQVGNARIGEFRVGEGPEEALGAAREPQPPPRVAREVEGNRGKVVLEDGTEMWKSEHRKMLKDYLRSLDAYAQAGRGGLEGDLQASVHTAEHGAVTSEMPPPSSRPTQAQPGREPRTGEMTAEPRPTRELPRPAPNTIVDEAAGALARADAAEAKAAASRNKADIKAAEKAQREAEKAMDRAQTRVQPAEPAPQPDQTGGVRVARSDRNAYDYFANLGKDGRGPSPGDTAAAKVAAHLNALEQLSQGRFTATKALEVAESLGVPSIPRGPLAEKYVQLWALRRLADGAVAESRGVSRGLGHQLGKRAQAAVLGAAGFHIGGPMGAAIGASLGWSANLASSVGRARQAIVKVAEKMLSNGKAGAIARAISYANYTPPEGYTYNDGPPTTDLKARVEQLHLAASDEDGTRGRIRKALGDMSLYAPEVARAAEDTTWNRIRVLSVSAPTYMWQGVRELGPGVQEERRFRELETATWNPQMLLDAAASGSMTSHLAHAMAMQHAELQRVLSTEILSHPDAIKHMSPLALKQAELITGIPLTAGGDPAFVMRQQAIAPPGMEPQQPGKGGGGKPQALKITAPPPTQAQAQGASGRAPGN